MSISRRIEEFFPNTETTCIEFDKPTVEALEMNPIGKMEVHYGQVDSRNADEFARRMALSVEEELEEIENGQVPYFSFNSPPCQSFTTNNLSKVFEDPKNFEYAATMDHMRLYRPVVVTIENVVPVTRFLLPTDELTKEEIRMILVIEANGRAKGYQVHSGIYLGEYSSPHDDV